MCPSDYRAKRCHDKNSNIGRTVGKETPSIRQTGPDVILNGGWFKPEWLKWHRDHQTDASGQAAPSPAASVQSKGTWQGTWEQSIEAFLGEPRAGRRLHSVPSRDSDCGRHRRDTCQLQLCLEAQVQGTGCLATTDSFYGERKRPRSCPPACKRMFRSRQPELCHPAIHEGGWEGELLSSAEEEGGIDIYSHPRALARTQKVPPAPPRITRLINKSDCVKTKTVCLCIK